MFSKSIFSSKTFWAMLLPALSAWGAYLQGTVDLQAAIGATVMALIGMGMRFMTDGPVHLATPHLAEQATPDSVIVKTPQSGFSTLTMCLLLAAVAVTLLVIVPLMQGCASTPTAQSVAYDAEVAADEAVRLIPPLLASHTIDKATAVRIVEAADLVYNEAQALRNCTTRCDSAAVSAALAGLEKSLPGKKS